MSGKTMPTTTPVPPPVAKQVQQQQHVTTAAGQQQQRADAAAASSDSSSTSLHSASPPTTAASITTPVVTPATSASSAAAAPSVTPTPAPSSHPAVSHSFPQSLLTSHAHYGTDLWDSIPAVAAQSESSKASLARLTRFLKEKAELDREYAKSLKKIIGRMQIADVPRVADIPVPPQAAAQAAQAAVAQALKDSNNGTHTQTAATTQQHTQTPGHTDASTTSSATAPPSSTDVSSSSTTAAPGVLASPLPPAPAPPVVDPLSFDRFLMAFRNLHLTLATNRDILSAKITEQVAKPIGAHREQHAALQKKLMGELDRYTASYTRHLDTLLASRSAAMKACQELEHAQQQAAAAAAAAQASASNADDRGAGGGGGVGGGGNSTSVVNELVGAFKADTASLIRRALVADTKYVAAVKSMRGFRQATDAQLAHVLQGFEDLELARVQEVRAGLRHYMTVHASMFSSNSKNASAVQAVEAKVNEDVDRAYFILLHRTGKLPIALPEYTLFRGHPNYQRAKEEEEHGVVGRGSTVTTGGGVGDMSSFSSAQMEAMAAAEAEAMMAGGGGGNGGVALPIASAILPTSSTTTKSKSSGWGWLNTLAAVLPGNKQTHRSAASVGIDHDAEQVLTRGGYDHSGAGVHRSSSGSEGLDGMDDWVGADSDNPSASPQHGHATASRKGTSSGEHEGDELEEKTPERVQAEVTLSELFDAITGRVASKSGASVTPSPNSPSPSPVSATSAASASAPTVTTPSHASSSHDSVTYSPSLSRPLTASELSLSDSLFSTPEGRKSFASVLNRQRNTSGGLRLASRASLERLGEWVLSFLDHARQAMHVSPTQLVMIMSQSFFIEETEQEAEGAEGAAKKEGSSPRGADSRSEGNSGGVSSGHSPATGKLHRTYLLSLIRGHPIWTDLRFWEEAFFDAYNSKIRRSTAARVHKWHSDIEQAEGMHTRKQVCFSTLSTFAHNMSEFGMSPRDVVSFVDKISQINELEADHVDMLRSMEAYTLQRRQEAAERRNSDARIEPRVHQRGHSEVESEQTRTRGDSNGDDEPSSVGSQLVRSDPDDDDDDGAHAYDEEDEEPEGSTSQQAADDSNTADDFGAAHDL